MKKTVKKFAKFLLLIAVIFSDLMTPISVLADELSSTPNKGDVGINKSVSSDGGNSATVSNNVNLEEEGDVSVTKTVSKTDVLGRYKVEFNIKGKDIRNEKEIIKPVYAVVVFDRSGSMKSEYTDTDECERYAQGWYQDENGNWVNGRYCSRYKQAYNNKWENAVAGAKLFANTLSTNIPTANIALVAFSGNKSGFGYTDSDYNDAEVVRGFKTGSEATLDDANFGSPNGGTNLEAGLYEANKLLEKAPADAYKYVVVISDGQPTFYYDENGYTRGDGSNTNDNTYDATISMANTLKNATKAEIFSIGYILPEGKVYKDKTAADILTEVASPDVEDSNIIHYTYADPTSIANTFTNIAKELSIVKAGTKAVLTDKLGSAFKITSTDGTQRSFVSEEIKEITEEGTTISFYIDIDQDSPTEWYDTNAGFTLTYTDHRGEEKSIQVDENPQVYWVQNEYEYVVNYYKDSMTSENKIASDTRIAVNGTVINEENVDRDKYLPEGYKFESITPESITVLNDGVKREINILYTIKKFDYKVNYYYDNTLDNSLDIKDVSYGTKVDASSYYLDSDSIREGYSLDTTRSDNGTYTITSNEVVIDIYYKRNNYGYTVNYFFNSEKGFSDDSSAIYGDKITAESKWLSNDRLSSNGKSDYFLDPSREVDNNGEVTIGTDASSNVLNIYYINTNFDNANENIVKSTSTNKVVSSNDLVSYTLKYNSSINNVRKDDRVVVTIKDTLPGSIDTNKSTLNGGVYNSENNTITWTFTYTIEEFTKIYNVNEKIDYTVLYTDYLSNNGGNLNNTVVGNTKVVSAGLDDKVTDGSESSANVPVEIKGTVNVYFKDEEGNDISSKTALGEALAGTDYSTTAKDIFGYTLDESKLPENKDGKYIEGNIDVIYTYTKNDGNITKNEVSKEGPETINSIDGVFDYKLTYVGRIENYVGKAKLVLTDKLPYELDLNNSSIDNRCVYSADAKTITCTKDYDITENTDISEEFDLSLVFNGVDSNKVVNKVESKLTLDNNSSEDNDEVETIVNKGTVVATYKDTEGNTLSNNETSTGLAGSNYTTNEKSFYGYTLKEVKGNRNGKYIANTEIQVDYIYTKNDGSVIDNKVTKVQNNIITDIDSEYNYVLSYKGKIKDYNGEVTLELTDTLPYNAIIISKDNKCSVNGKTIVCRDVYTINQENQEINAAFNIVLKYTNVGAEVKNVVKSKLIYGKNSVTDEDFVVDEIPSGTVVATYKDTDGNTLSNNETSTDLAGSNYTTEQKDIFGYTFKEVTGADTKGKYVGNQTLTVNYIYTKNDGDITENEVSKEGPETINSIDGVFNYKLTYVGRIENYVGKAKLVLTDKLPYELDLDNSSIDNRCVYSADAKTITCTKDYDITENTDISEEFDLSLVFNEVDSNKVVNKVESKLTLDNNSSEGNDEVETIVNKGTVVATYRDTDGNTLSKNETSTDLAGRSYTTEQKDIFGYTFKEATGADTNGKYVGNQTLTVNYIYTKNDGEIDNPDTKKEGLTTISSVDGRFDYSITASGEIKDYVGEATLTVVDKLPYELDLDKSNIDNRCIYDADTNTITCSVSYSAITKEDYTDGIYNIEEVFNLSLVFVGVDSDTVVNKAMSTIDLDGNKKTTEDEAITEVYKGTVEAIYVDTDGNVISDSVITSGLSGTKYTTEQKEIMGYTFKEVTGADTEGVYAANETLVVKYIYEKNIGNGDIEELPPQTGVTGVNSIPFEYIISLVLLFVLGKNRKLVRNED